MPPGYQPCTARTVGKALVDELNAQPRIEFSVIGVKPEHNKQTRMSIQSAKFESGQVFFPTEASWLAYLERELFSFPRGRHDDQVDSICQALAYASSGYDLEAMVGNTSHMNIFSRYGFPMP